MTYFVGAECLKCKYTDCVEVCPVDCFYEGEEFLAIDPEECIDCGVCVSECPVNAIRSEDDMEKMTLSERSEALFWLKYNSSKSKEWKNKRITKIKAPLPDYEKYASMTDKAKLLKEYNEWVKCQ